MVQKKISKPDLLLLLRSMGIVLPTDTKLSEEDLRIRVGQALDASQELEHLFNSKTVDPQNLGKWNNGESVYKAIHRGNFAEQVEGTMTRPKKGDRSLKEETFREMRQTSYCVAYGFDKQMKDFWLADSQQKGIFLRALNIYTIKDGIPMILLAYRELGSSPNITTEKEIASLQPNAQCRLDVSISPLEHFTWLELLRKNREKLNPQLRELLEEESSKNTQMHASFMVPLCPLDMASIGRVAKDTGCTVCGDQNANLCVGCRCAYYCGKECQRKDWPTHKTFCKAVRDGASWHVMMPTDLDATHPFRSLINSRASLHRMPDLIDTKGRESAIIGRVFLVKFQLPMMLTSSNTAHMLMYDRQRNFVMEWYRRSDPKLFDEAKRIMGARPKFYRWLRRISDNQFEICLEKGPQQDPDW